MTPEDKAAADLAAAAPVEPTEPTEPAAPDAAPQVDAPVKSPKFMADVEVMDFLNDEPEGVLCSIVFRDGTTATGTAPITGTLGEAQAAATDAALATTH